VAGRARLGFSPSRFQVGGLQRRDARRRRQGGDERGVGE